MVGGMTLSERVSLIGAAIAIITAIGGAAYSIDARYAKAQELAMLDSEVNCMRLSGEIITLTNQVILYSQSKQQNTVSNQVVETELQTARMKLAAKQKLYDAKCGGQ
jgi:hypothetical protein